MLAEEEPEAAWTAPAPFRPVVIPGQRAYGLAESGVGENAEGPGCQSPARLGQCEDNTR